MAVREHDALNHSEIGAQTVKVALKCIFLRARIEQNGVTNSTTVRGNKARKAVRSAAQALTSHHLDATPHQAGRLALDMRRRARKYIRGVVDQDQDFEAIDRHKPHARFLAYAPRYLQCHVAIRPHLHLPGWVTSIATSR